MSKEYDKKTWSISGGKYSYDEEFTLTREEADKLAAKKAAGNYDQVQIWELVGTVQNKMPTDLIVTPIA
jgi:hypothetical protein